MCTIRIEAQVLCHPSLIIDGLSPSLLPVGIGIRRLTPTRMSAKSRERVALDPNIMVGSDTSRTAGVYV